jgi:thiamine pyrophosphate-dependent acetolactate synthase large subunit-like protein
MRPGATNLVTGIADAKMDSVPLVCTTGQVRSALIGTDAFQETDVFGLTLSMTKWSRLVKSIPEIPEVIAEGFHWARSGRPGPVMIDIPTDILKASVDFSGPVQFTSARWASPCRRPLAFSWPNPRLQFYASRATVIPDEYSGACHRAPPRAAHQDGHHR